MDNSSPFNSLSQFPPLTPTTPSISTPSPPGTPIPRDDSQFANDQEVLKLIKKDSLSLIGGVGGHGGFYAGKVTDSQGEEHHLFLKPLDPVEGVNYEFLQVTTSSLKGERTVLSFMPHVYGSVEIEGKTYMVMENLRVKDGEQIVDLKLVKGGQSDPDELKATRGKTKGVAVRIVHLFQTAVAGDFLTLTESQSKLGRTLGAGSSWERLEEILKTTLGQWEHNDQIESIGNLQKEMEQLVESMKKSSMAFIGASVFVFVKDQAFKIYLADPAHAIADDREVQNYEKDRPKDSATRAALGEGVLYSGKLEDAPYERIKDFQARRKANVGALESILDVIQKVHYELKGDQHTDDNTSLMRGEK